MDAECVSVQMKSFALHIHKQRDEWVASHSCVSLVYSEG